MSESPSYLDAEDAAEVCRYHAERADLELQMHLARIRQNIVAAHQGLPGTATLARTAMQALAKDMRRWAGMIEADLDEEWRKANREDRAA